MVGIVVIIHWKVLFWYFFDWDDM